MDDVETREPRSQRRERVRSVAGLCVLAVLLGAGAISWERRSGAAAAPVLELAPLPEPSAACAEDLSHARHAARVALDTARARMQRYAFAPGDGRDALARLAEAVDCARLSGDAALQAEAATELARVHERIGREVREHAQRYALLRQRERLADAEDDIVFLTELGWPEHGELADQLRRDRIQLEDDAKEAK